MGTSKNEDLTGGKYGRGGGENNNIDPHPADAETKRKRFRSSWKKKRDTKCPLLHVISIKWSGMIGPKNSIGEFIYDMYPQRNGVTIDPF